jgi:hypothetical protein
MQEVVGRTDILFITSNGKGDTQIHRHHHNLLSLLTKIRMEYTGKLTDMDIWTDRHHDDFISLLLFF